MRCWQGRCALTTGDFHPAQAQFLQFLLCAGGAIKRSLDILWRNSLIVVAVQRLSDLALPPNLHQRTIRGRTR